MDFADKLDMMDDDCDIQGFPIDDDDLPAERYRVRCKWLERSWALQRWKAEEPCGDERIMPPGKGHMMTDQDKPHSVLKNIRTCELVAELTRREGVETQTAEPYQDVSVSVNGPAVVLVVID